MTLSESIFNRLAMLVSIAAASAVPVLANCSTKAAAWAMPARARVWLVIEFNDINNGSLV